MNHDGQVRLLEIFPLGGPPTTPERFGYLFTQAQAEMALGGANKYLDMLPEIRLSQMNSQSLWANSDDNDHKTSCPISLNRIRCSRHKNRTTTKVVKAIMTTSKAPRKQTCW